MKSLILGSILLIFATNIIAQIITEEINPMSVDSNTLSYLENAPIIEMPEFKYQWIEEDEKESDATFKPPRFGYAYETKINNFSDGIWIKDDHSLIWTLTISSKGALSINLIFNEFILSEGANLYIYNDKKTIRVGPVTSKHNKKSHKLSTDIILGSSLTIILIEPTCDESKKSIISIGHVVHGFSDACGFGQASLGCHINASCPQANNLSSEKNAVARILVWNNTRCCSGTLINNACSCPDQIKIFSLKNLRPSFVHSLTTSPKHPRLHLGDRTLRSGKFS